GEEGFAALSRIPRFADGAKHRVRTEPFFGRGWLRRFEFGSRECREIDCARRFGEPGGRTAGADISVTVEGGYFEHRPAGVVLADSGPNGDLLAFVEGLEEAGVHAAAFEPARAEGFDDGPSHVRENRNARHKASFEAVLPGDRVVVDL